jgi:hypothetical protein
MPPPPPHGFFPHGPSHGPGAEWPGVKLAAAIDVPLSEARELLRAARHGDEAAKAKVVAALGEVPMGRHAERPGVKLAAAIDVPLPEARALLRAARHGDEDAKAKVVAALGEVPMGRHGKCGGKGGFGKGGFGKGGSGKGGFGCGKGGGRGLGLRRGCGRLVRGHGGKGGCGRGYGGERPGVKLAAALKLPLSEARALLRAARGGDGDAKRQVRAALENLPDGGMRGGRRFLGGGKKLEGGAQRLAASLGIEADDAAKLLKGCGRTRPAPALADALGVPLPEARALLLVARRGDDRAARDVVMDALRSAAVDCKDDDSKDEDAVLVDAAAVVLVDAAAVPDAEIAATAAAVKAVRIA